MRRSTGCLAEHELLILLADEPDSAALRSHVEACPACRTRLDELQAHVAECRAIGPLPARSRVVSTGRDPGAASPGVSPAPRLQEPGAGRRPPWRPATSRPAPTGPAGPDTLSWDRNEATIATPPPVPAAIGKYLVVGRFARSGQAEVFRVVHPQFHRDLVLKLAQAPIGAGDRSTIIEEGRHLAGLEHPGIVRVHDLDFHQGRPFLVMEYIRARTLAQYAREEKITPRRAAAVVAELAAAVGFAHRRGVVHQDIKPANILIDEAGRPRLIDFGLAWQQDAWSGPAAGSEGGTYAFIAPEQARLEPDRIRTLSDVFALGAVLWFLLTGQAPFASATPVEERERARRCDFDRSALQAAGVPHQLERICLRAMAAQPAARYATAEDLTSDLNRRLRRPRWGVHLVAAAALVLAGVAAWRLLPTGPDDHRRFQPAPANRLTVPGDTVQVPRASAAGVPNAPHGPQDLVHVYRTDQVIDLKDAVPLQTGDRLVIRCNLPRDLHASLFWFDTEGELTELAPVAVSSRDSWDELIYPPKGVVPLTGPPGTELVLVCARRSGRAGREDVERLFHVGQPLPQLPRRAVVRWDQDEVKVELLRGVGTPEGHPMSNIEDRIEAIRQAARNQFDFVAGVAFRHQDRPEPRSSPP